MSARAGGRWLPKRMIFALAIALISVGIFGAMAAYANSHAGLQRILGQLVFDGTIVAASAPIAVRASRRHEWRRSTRQVIMWCVGVGSVVNLVATLLAEITLPAVTSNPYVALCGAVLGVVALIAVIAWFVGLCVWGAAEGKGFLAPERTCGPT